MGFWQQINSDRTLTRGCLWQKSHRWVRMQQDFDRGFSFKRTLTGVWLWQKSHRCVNMKVFILLLLFPYWIIFQTRQSLEPLSSTPKGDRHMRPWTFLDEIQFRTTFIWTIFWSYAYFWQRWVLELFPFRVILRTCQSFEPPSSTPGGR